MALTPPPKGAMYLFDYATPPLPPGSYRIHSETDVTVDAKPHALDHDNYFDVVGPRFNLPPTDVSGVFPPRNGHGPYQDALAQVAIKRRTLPWERPIDAGAPHPIGEPGDGLGLGPDYPTPWVALLLFEEGEYSLMQGVPLENVVPKAIFQQLGSPSNILCDALEADLSLVKSIMPSKEELQLLSHVRWVNKDDRELSVEGSDGWFAIVMTNRVPSPNAKCRACLVSVEQRTDLVKADPPPSAPPPADVVVHIEEIAQRDAGFMEVQVSRLQETSQQRGSSRLTGIVPAKARLVLLHSWQFVCEGNGTFFDLMQGLDVGMIGKLALAGRPPLTDTSHLPIDLHDRGGSEETALYRGPLVPFVLARDPLGPYHSADQARRATPETGVEDISYAAAFEVGRLLAAADARLAQELMRWRRQAYRQSARLDMIAAVQIALALPPGISIPQLSYEPISPIAATGAATLLVKGSGPIADRYGMTVASRTPGLNPQNVSTAWGLTIQDANVILGVKTPGTLGIEVPPVARTPRANTTLDAVLKDQASLARLGMVRDRKIQNAAIKLGGSK
ncbi:MAG TPA: hypothetical protein VNV86_16395 [Candidatus Acidoferrum sp.]|jgi:hypothetical protein|nr:hypothetical protein [Candidatus Acidoferrum sp.]